MTRKSETTLLIITYLTAAIIGLHDGLLGVAWPSIRHSFDVSLDSVGLILTAGTAGFILSSVSAGRFTARGHLGVFMLVSGVFKVAGIIGLVLLPSWWGVVVASLLGGIGTGGIDTSMNTYVASNHGAGRMNWLHAGYGVGVTLGPLMMTSILSLGQDWRWGYVLAGAAQSLLVLAVAATLASWQLRSTSNGGEPTAAHARSRDTLRIPAVWLGIALFFTYTGTEVSSGQWAYTLLSEGRGVAETVAGLWVSVYWGSFTVGRFLIGFAADHIEQTLLVRASMVGSALGAALIWWNPANGFSFAGLALLGFSLAPVFPAMIFTTGQRLGQEHAPNAIGFQMGAASLGSAALPGLAGVLAQRIDLEVIGPFLLAGVVLMFALHEALIGSAGERTASA